MKSLKLSLMVKESIILQIIRCIKVTYNKHQHSENPLTAFAFFRFGERYASLRK